jgi:hypothetical protein
MPLIGTENDMTLRSDPLTIGFWMQIDETLRHDRVWVEVTQRCIEALGAAELINLSDMVDIAETNRERIERAASRIFDREGVDIESGLHHGKPILTVASADLLGV